MKINYFGVTTVGRRQQNEDSYWHHFFRPSQGCIQAIAVVCDGMGGHVGGKVASGTAIDVIKKCVQNPPLQDNEIEDWIVGILTEIQKNLIARVEKNPELSEMGTTLVMEIFTKRKAWIAHIGDSRAYQIDERGAHQLTRDHTAVQDALDRNVYTIEDIRENDILRRMTSALSRHLGPDSDTSADVCEIPLRGSQWLLLCSDGLTGNLAEVLVSEYEIWRNLTGTDNLEDAVHNLVSISYQNGSTDNITVIAIELNRVERSEEPVILQPRIDDLLPKEHLPEPVSSSWRNKVLVGLIVICLIFLSYLIFEYKESRVQPGDVTEPTPAPTESIEMPTQIEPSPVPTGAVETLVPIQTIQTQSQEIKSATDEESMSASVNVKKETQAETPSASAEIDYNTAYSLKSILEKVDIAPTADISDSQDEILSVTAAKDGINPVTNEP